MRFVGPCSWSSAVLAQKEAMNSTPSSTCSAAEVAPTAPPTRIARTSCGNATLRQASTTVRRNSVAGSGTRTRHCTKAVHGRHGPKVMRGA